MDNVSIFTALMQGKRISIEFHSSNDLNEFLAAMRLRKSRENHKTQRASVAYGIPLGVLGSIKQTIQYEPKPLPPEQEWPAVITIFLGDPIPKTSTPKFTIIDITE